MAIKESCKNSDCEFIFRLTYSSSVPETDTLELDNIFHDK